MTDKKPANENVWYLLATAYGEVDQNNPDKLVENEYNNSDGTKTIEDNRRVWNAWAESRISKTEWEDVNAYKLKNPNTNSMEIETRINDLVAWEREDYLAVRARFKIVSVSPNKIPAAYNTKGGAAVNFDYDTFDALLNMADFCLKMGITAKNTTFTRDAIFTDTTIGSASFKSAIFHGKADFSKKANSSKSEFIEDASFEYTQFNGKAYFEGTTFSKADFSNAKFKKHVTFKGATFTQDPPDFRDAEFSSDVIFEQGYDKWPDVKDLKKPAETSLPNIWRNRYRVLANLTDKQMLPDETRFFVRQEFRCRQASEGKWRDKFLSGLYSGLSDYGHSAFRPFGWLVLLWLFGAIAFGCNLSDAAPVNFTCELFCPSWEGAGYSLANVFPIYGFEGRFFEPEIIRDLPPFLKTISGLQTILSLPLLFLLGLGIRNRFRLR